MGNHYNCVVSKHPFKWIGSFCRSQPSIVFVITESNRMKQDKLLHTFRFNLLEYGLASCDLFCASWQTVSSCVLAIQIFKMD